MTKFYYKAAGSTGGYSAGIIEAENQDAATEKLDATYGVVRDEDGTQTNNDMIKVAFIKEAEFDRIEKDRGEELTHNLTEDKKND